MPSRKYIYITDDITWPGNPMEVPDQTFSSEYCFNKLDFSLWRLEICQKLNISMEKDYEMHQERERRKQPG